MGAITATYKPVAKKSLADEAQAYFGHAKAGDKAVKLGKAVLDVGAAIARAGGHSGAGLDTASGYFKDARTVFGLFNAPTKMIGLGHKAKETYHLLKDMKKRKADEPIEVYHSQKVEIVEDEKGNLVKKPSSTTLKGNKQKLLQLSANVTDMVGASTYIFGFGVARPISFIKKCGANVGKSASSIGKSFSLIMFANHIASWLGAVSKISLAYAKKGTKKTGEFLKSIVKHLLLLLEQTLHLGLDVVRNFLTSVPNVVSLVLALLIGIVGVTRVWFDSNPKSCILRC